MRDFLRYWRHNIATSFIAWATADAVVALLFAMAMGAVFVAFSISGLDFEKVTKGDVFARLVVGVVIALGAWYPLLLLFVNPARLWNRDQREKKRLADELDECRAGLGAEGASPISFSGAHIDTVVVQPAASPPEPSPPPETPEVSEVPETVEVAEPSPDDTTEQTVRNRVVRISEWTGRDQRIHGKTFEDCHIVGPGVLVPLTDTTLEGGVMVGTPDAILWEVLPPRTQVVGAIGLENCTFLRCEFRDIGFAGPPALIEKLRGIPVAG